MWMYSLNLAMLPEQEGKEAAGALPYALMEAPPLALFSNGVAAAFNELRHCAPLVLQGPVTQVVQARSWFLSLSRAPCKRKRTRLCFILFSD